MYLIWNQKNYEEYILTLFTVINKFRIHILIEENNLNPIQIHKHILDLIYY